MNLYCLKLLSSNIVATATENIGEVSSSSNIEEYTLVGILLIAVATLWVTWRKDHERYLKANENAASALSDALELIKNEPKANEEIKKVSQKTVESIQNISNKTTDSIIHMTNIMKKEAEKTRKNLEIVEQKCENALDELLDYIKKK